MTRDAYLWGQWHAAIGYHVSANPFLTGGQATAWLLGYQDYVASLCGRPTPRIEPEVTFAMRSAA